MMWKEVTAERYDEQLGVVPPAIYTGDGFLVGEPFDHRTCAVRGVIAATYAALVQIGDKFYEGPNMTLAEFKVLDLKTVPS